jgi:hypothetical protein
MVFEYGQNSYEAVCEACLRRSPGELKSVVLERSQERAEQAAALVELAHHLPEIPTWDQWQAANEIAAAKYPAIYGADPQSDLEGPF